MTFLEAAIEVLKREGKPLPTKRLAELAVKLNLLSVVGRDPEGTMAERLGSHLEKDGARSELVQLQPGLFGLRAYPARPYPPVEAEANGTSGDGAQASASPSNGERAEGAAAAPGGERKRRRRRRGRGRGGAQGAPADAAAGEEPDTEGDEGEEPAQGELALAEGAGAEAPAKKAPVAAAAEGAEEAGEEGAEEEGEAEEGAAGAGEAAGERRGRRRSRRGGRGRRRADRPAAGTTALPEAPTLVDVVPKGERAEPADEAGAALAAAAADVASEEPRVTDEEAGLADAEIAEPGAGAGAEGEADEAAAADEALDLEGEEDELIEDEGPYDDELDLPSGPLLAPTAGTEEATRTDEDRAVMRATPGFRVGDDRVHHHGGRRERERGRRRDRDRDRDGKRGGPGRDQQQQRAQNQGGQQQRPSGPPPSAKPAAAPQAGAPSPSGAPAPSGGGGLAQVSLPRPGGPVLTPMLEAVVEALRGAEGRPLHVSAIAEEVVRRKLVDDKGGANEIARQVRAALIRDERERHVEGLRHRFLNLGGGVFALAEKRLEAELLPLERELADRAARVRDATRAAIRRRLLRLAPAAFEAIGRALLDKMGVERVELVRRADGVAYYGGVRSTGVGQGKVLVAMRAGEQEISRRAVGELRAGLQIRGYDEGLLFAAGRPSADGTAELKSSPGVTAYDGQTLAGLMVKHGLGVRRLSLPVDYLDLELFHELTDGPTGEESQG